MLKKRNGVILGEKGKLKNTQITRLPSTSSKQLREKNEMLHLL